MASLALAIIATAVMAASLMELRLAKADQARAIAEYALAGAHQSAALTVASARQNDRLAWTMTAGGHTVSALAEPQAAKLSLDAGADLDNPSLSKLGVTDTGDLRARLKAFTSGKAPDDALADADAAPLWRACARSLISAYGKATTSRLTRAAAPITGEGFGRIGEVWRIRLALPDGWVDDRIVRFTGDAARPAGVVERRFSRGEGGEARCESLFPQPPTQ